MTRMGPDQIISELRSWMVESNNENNEGYLRKHYNDLLNDVFDAVDDMKKTQEKIDAENLWLT